jgi:proteasome beta subunit
VDAAQEDVATGGPDPARGIFPTVLVVTADGASSVGVDDIRSAYEAVSGGPEGSAAAGAIGGDA